MGAVFFIAFLLMLLGGGVGLLLLGLLFRYLAKRSLRKCYRVLKWVCFALSGLMCLVPVGFFLFLLIQNLK